MAAAYFEIVVEGPLAVLKGFVAGWLLAQKRDLGAIRFIDESAVACESAITHLAEWMRLHANVSHLLVPEALEGAFAASVSDAAGPLGIRLRSQHRIESASFHYSYVAYSQALAAEIKRVLGQLGERVALMEDAKPEIVIDTSAAGVELYSPAHAYEERGSGTAKGDVDAILTLREQAQRNSLIAPEKIQLQRA